MKPLIILSSPLGYSIGVVGVGVNVVGVIGVSVTGVVGVIVRLRIDARYDLTILTLGSPDLPARFDVSWNSSSHVLGSPKPLALILGPISLATNSSRLAYLPADSLNKLTTPSQVVATRPL
ncbi:MAG: hypothetical protein QXI24_01565 [Acidilobaceae archaeon]